MIHTCHTHYAPQFLRVCRTSHTHLPFTTCLYRSPHTRTRVLHTPHYCHAYTTSACDLTGLHTFTSTFDFTTLFTFTVTAFTYPTTRYSSAPSLPHYTPALLPDSDLHHGHTTRSSYDLHPGYYTQTRYVYHACPASVLRCFVLHISFVGRFTLRLRVAISFYGRLLRFVVTLGGW